MNLLQVVDKDGTTGAYPVPMLNFSAPLPTDQIAMTIPSQRFMWDFKDAQAMAFNMPLINNDVHFSMWNKSFQFADVTPRSSFDFSETVMDAYVSIAFIYRSISKLYVKI